MFGMEKMCWYLCAILCVWQPLLSGAYLNVFIHHREVMKLMGLEADLYYVHEGTINSYAMQFVVPVPVEISVLEFSWQSLTSYPLPYVINIEYENQHEGSPSVLGAPVLSIPAKGYVPQQIETFMVHLPCHGNATAKVPLSINVLVYGPPRANDTVLHFKREKFCLKESPTTTTSVRPESAHAPSPDPLMIGGAACALGLLLAAALVTSVMVIRARKHIPQNTLHPNFATTAYGSHQNVLIRLDPIGRSPSVNSGSYATIASLNKYPADMKKSCNIFERFCSVTAPSPYATALLPGGDTIPEAIYANPEAVVYPTNNRNGSAFYPSAQLTQMAPPTTSRPPMPNGRNTFCSRDRFSEGIEPICHLQPTLPNTWHNRPHGGPKWTQQKYIGHQG